MGKLLAAGGLQAAGLALAAVGAHKLGGAKGLAVVAGYVLYRIGDEMTPPQPAALLLDPARARRP